MKKTFSTLGFTIVELLIVIVVIGILAAISLVAYKGAQQKSQNTQTISAITQWAKIIRMYEVEVGSMPTIASCLGSNYTYGPTGTDVSGFQCRQDIISSGIVIDPSFMTLMQKYSQSKPQPSVTTTGYVSDVNWYRGAYYYPTNPARIDYMLAGGGTPCPDIGGIKQVTRQVFGDTTRCITNF
ncbi:prepilin-type N-terminal cleavage/methylation domain-containing protein [Candidatus Saccharibacteria bacterium]|nr:prepilin-type N-terminal cleavage/methylation domain-containing protein [Candidatus Saccharibacteria bacterium]